MTASRLEETACHSRACVSAPTALHATGEARIDAGGTAWRMRSLIAMGHDCTRLARAMNVPPRNIQSLVRGSLRTVTPQFRAVACQLWDAWWDKTPPQNTASQRRAAAKARHMALRHDWPAAAGLDEDELDEPGYRPWSRYRPATGTGVAPDFSPVHLSQPARETA
jgi:hypothetical protein